MHHFIEFLRFVKILHWLITLTKVCALMVNFNNFNKWKKCLCDYAVVLWIIKQVKQNIPVHVQFK